MAPLTIVALTVTVPAAVVFRLLPLMVAPVFPALATDHTIVLFVALAGFTVPVRVRAVPTVPLVGTPVIPVTGTMAVPTVTTQVAVLLPSPEVTVMVAVPAETAVMVTCPAVVWLAGLTVATAGALLVQFRYLFVALVGTMVAVRTPVAPGLRLMVGLSK